MSESKSIAAATTPSSQHQAEPSEDLETRAARPPGSLPLVLALLALGASIGLAATAYFTWNQVQQLLGTQSRVEAQVEDRMQPLRSSLGDLNQALQKQRQQLDSKLQSLAGQQQNLQEKQQVTGKRLNVLAALIGRSEEGWYLAEVEYLLRIANQRLQLQRDVTTTLAALKAADTRLRDLADPHFLSVREQIARDLEAVEAVPAVDAEGISVTLSTLLYEVDRLQVAGTRYEPAAETEQAELETDNTAQSWQDLPRLLRVSLSGLFRVREHDRPVGPLLPPEREYFLRENLRLQLTAARLALLRGDQAQYQATLETAGNWLEAYFAADSDQVSDLVAQLKELGAINILPGLPDISGSLRVLRQQMKLSEQQPVLPVVPDTQAPGSAEPLPEGSPAQANEETAP